MTIYCTNFSNKCKFQALFYGIETNIVHKRLNYNPNTTSVLVSYGFVHLIIEYQNHPFGIVCETLFNQIKTSFCW